MSRSIKDVTRALQVQFAGAKPLPSLPKDTRRLLKQFVDEHEDNTDDDEFSRANAELKTIWEKYVERRQQNLGAFAGVLRELRPALDEEDVLSWWQQAIRPIIGSVAYTKAAFEDALEFVVGFMASDEDDEGNSTYASTAAQLCRELLALYTEYSQPLNAADDGFSVVEKVQVVQQVEDVLIAFGRKRPKHLFHHLDDIVKPASSRLPALTLLSSFLRHQTPHLYLVINTPLVEDLLKSLMNDTSTTILAPALTSLIMLLPHIPGSLAPYLPRLFLVYSRLLCWEKFSPLSTEAQRNLVTDDRIPNFDDEDDQDRDDVGIDDTWEKAGPQGDDVEASTPELMTYFTYLYGLYPLNFMSYIRKPRRYLKDINFPDADAFDLDQTVIRSRTEQFRQVHLVHSNFYNLTIEEELNDPKWPNLDPADVVGDCNGLCVNNRTALAQPGPPPTGRLPDIPPLPPLNLANKAAISPAQSHVSLRSGHSWRDTQSTATSAIATDADSPILKPQIAAGDFAGTEQERIPPTPLNNLAYLQRQITLMRNELNFEKWHKAQYSTYIGQIMRRNVKEATVEAETLNLIHANRTLKKQLDQMRQDREATLKDSALTRKQANSLESNLTDKFSKFKSEQETWQADAEELRRLRSEISQYRDLLVATEARELKKSHQLQLVQQDLEDMLKLQSQLKQAQRKLNEYQAREFDFDKTKRENDLIHNENASLRYRVARFEQEHAQLRTAFATKVNELEFQLGLPDSPSRHSESSSEVQIAVQQALSESEGKLVQLKKSYARLLEKYTDLELEYQAVKSRLEASQGGRAGGMFSPIPDDRGSLAFDIIDDYAPSEAGFTSVSASDPSSRRFQPPIHGLPMSPGSSQTAMHNRAGLMFEPSRKNSTASSTAPAAFNQSAPLTHDENMSTFSDYSGTGSQGRRDKIQADSTVRVYGRGK